MGQDKQGFSSKLIFGQNQQAFTATGVFTIPNNVYRIFVEVFGAGGDNSAPGGYGADFFNVWPGQQYAVTIGAAGSGGGAGGTTSFGSLISATGGAGSAADYWPQGTAAGSSSATINITGGGSGKKTAGLCIIHW